MSFLEKEDKQSILDNIFKINVKQINLFDIECNIDEFQNTDILSILTNNLKINHYNYEKCYINNYKLINKNKNNIFKLPLVLIDYIFEFTSYIPKKLVFEIKNYAYFIYIQKLELIIKENNFDLLWYDPSDIDYSWSKKTIDNCTTLIDRIYNYF